MCSFASGSGEDAGVVARPGPDGATRLVALWFRGRGERLTVAQLRSACGAELPPYAIPSEFFRVPELPKTSNGKFNRKLLMESGHGEPFESEVHVPPRDELERTLCGIWQRLLGQARVGVEDDFFLLGGDSIRAMQCLLEVEATLGRRLTPTVLAPTATVAALAKHLREPVAESNAVSLVPLKSGGSGARCTWFTPFLGHSSITGPFWSRLSSGGPSSASSVPSVLQDRTVPPIWKGWHAPPSTPCAPFNLRVPMPWRAFLWRVAGVRDGETVAGVGTRRFVCRHPRHRRRSSP